ncbi:hypothetical protein [Rathayibacter toxicus]|nr:hypothetical protein [Rathayibacter toxicus]
MTDVYTALRPLIGKEPGPPLGIHVDSYQTVQEITSVGRSFTVR